jgi:hypothetical protein
MNKKSLSLVVLIAGVLMVFGASSLYAGTNVADVIKMENKAYAKHTKGIVEFTHKKHMEDYAKANPDLYKNGCGVCHHDENNKPLSALKAGDDVKNCIECHKKPGEMPAAEKKAMKAEKLKKAEQNSKKLAYHAEALHDNCRGCHKDFNKMTKTKKAPTTCTKCHPKTAK